MLSVFNDFTFGFRQQLVYPGIREFPAGNGRAICRLRFLPALEPPQEFLGDLLRYDHHSVEITDDDISRIDDDSAALDRVIDFSRSPVKRADRRNTSREGGEVEFLYPGQ